MLEGWLCPGFLLEFTPYLIRGRNDVGVGYFLVKELEKLRKEIDAIDMEILRLLNQRARLAIDIGKIKKEEKLSTHVPQREREIYERLERENKGPFPNEALRVVFREIMSASLSLEQPLRVAYFGPKATFTHLASMKKFGFFANYIPANSIRCVPVYCLVYWPSSLSWGC